MEEVTNEKRAREERKLTIMNQRMPIDSLIERLGSGPPDEEIVVSTVHKGLMKNMNAVEHAPGWYRSSAWLPAISTLICREPARHYAVGPNDLQLGQRSI